MSINTGDLSQMYLKPDGADRVERERRARLERDTASLRQRAPELGESLLEVFETLPSALSTAAAAELKRLQERYGKQHPRVRRAEQQQAQLQGMVVHLDAGAARARHLLEFVQLEGQFFHGVVADTASRPLADVPVRLELPRGQDALQGRTGHDGYFRVALPRMDGDTGNSEQLRARILLLNADGSTAHADPIPLHLDGATHYREYRIEAPRGCGDGQSPKPSPGTGKPEPDTPRPRPGLKTSTPLEHVKGIGPKRAQQLRAAGIKDLEALLGTPPDTLVEVLGFDVGPTREEAQRVLAEHRRAQASSGDPGRTRSGKRAADTPAASKPNNPKPSSTASKQRSPKG